MHGQDAAHVALGLAHESGLLNQRHVAVVEVDGVHHLRLLSELYQLARLLGVHRQRLLADDVLARGHDVAVHLEVEVIGRAVVNDLNFRVGQELPVIAIRLGNRQLVGLSLGEILAAFGDGCDFHEAEAAESLDMGGADETSADDACFDSLHG